MERNKKNLIGTKSQIPRPSSHPIYSRPIHSNWIARVIKFFAKLTLSIRVMASFGMFLDALTPRAKHPGGGLGGGGCCSRAQGFEVGCV